MGTKSMNSNTLRKSESVNATDTTRRYQLGMWNKKKLKKPDQFERKRFEKVRQEDQLLFLVRELTTIEQHISHEARPFIELIAANQPFRRRYS